MLAGRSVLITGGTGSFGRHMVDYALEQGCQRIRIFSRDEAKQDEMRRQYTNDSLQFYIGDVRLRDSVDHAMRGIDFVFHAAALKQVPSCEFFPLEAVRTNVLGSMNVVESALAHGVERVVCLSTDKAVLPVNAMGMTKALMEKAVQAVSRDSSCRSTVISCVRYGNVMYSRGSVIPLFVGQIIDGGPLTVTEPSMTRFMMSLPEAIELVQFAFDNAQPGDVFVRKAPACTIGDLAEALLKILNADNPISIIGRRHGEKLYETLATSEELRRAEDMGQFWRIPADTRGLNYSLYFTEGDAGVTEIEDYTSHSTTRLVGDELRALLLRLPELKAALDGHRRREDSA